MARFGKGTWIAALAFGLTAMTAATAEPRPIGNSKSTTMRGETPDHRGALLSYSGADYATASSRLDELVRQARETFVELHPAESGNYVIWSSIQENGDVLVTVLPYEDGGASASASGAEGPPDQPPPPAAYPRTPLDMRAATYHRERSRYIRDTTYRRDPIPHGGSESASPWYIQRDAVERRSGGHELCGGVGRPPCPKPQ